MRLYILYLLIIFLSNKAISQDKITRPFIIAFSERGIPFSWEENGVARGIMVDIAKEAINKRMKLKVSIRFYPWKRVLHYIKTGEADAIITNYTSERQMYTYASKELITNIRRMIYVSKDNPKINEMNNIRSLKDLSSYRIGTYIGNHWLKQRLGVENIIWGSDAYSALHMLSGGRFDIYLGNPATVDYRIKELGLYNIKMLPNILEDMKPSQFRLLIGKKSGYVAYLELFDQIIRDMKNDGTLQLIFDSYR